MPNYKESIVILVSGLLYGVDGNPTLNEISEFVNKSIKVKIRINVLGYWLLVSKIITNYKETIK